MTESKLHHFLPQFLLGGFAAKLTRKGDAQIWVFSTESRRFLSNVKNVAAESFFYGKVADGGIEALLAKSEGSWASMLQRVRDTRLIAESDTALVAQMVANFSVRTKHAREGITEALVDGAMEITDRVEDPRVALDLIRLLIDNDSDFVEGALRESLGIPDVVEVPDELTQWVVHHFEAMDPDTLQDDLAPLMTVVRATLEEGTAQLSEAHLNGLRKQLDNAEGRFADFHWWAQPYDVSPLILGDIGPIGVDEAGQIDIPARHGRDLVFIVLPISGTTAIVGATSKLREFQLDSSTLNRATARLSREFFIATQNTGRERDYAQDIGKCSDYLTKKERETLIDESLDDFPA